MWTWLCATCHKISYVLFRTQYLHTNVSTTRHVHARVRTLQDMFPRSVSTIRRFHTLKDGCLHTFWVTNSFLCVTLNIWHRVCTLFWLTKSCLCITFNIWHHVCHQISNRWLNLRTLLSKQLSTYEIMSENIGLTHIKDCDACSRWNDVPLRNFFDLHGCVRMKIFSWEHVSVYNLIHNFLCLCSTDMFPRSVSTTRRFHTLKDGCLHTFWVTNSFLCVTLNIWHVPCLTPNFP